MKSSLVLGVDGGATKTFSVVGDNFGNILGVGLAGPSNYQNIGLECALENIKQSVCRALSPAKITLETLDYAVFGLAGADFPIDFQTLRHAIKKIYPDLKFQVLNDAWIGFRAGTCADYGGIVVAGTGSNFAAMAPDGTKTTGRGMGYLWGGQDGARGLIQDALFFAFRSHDGTGPKTRLQEIVLSTARLSSYDELSFYLYQKRNNLNEVYTKFDPIVPEIFVLANEGDKICADILVNSGTIMGEIMGRMIKTLGFNHISHDIVTTGSLFTKGASSLLSDSFALSCRRYAPFARFKMPETEPALGAYITALERIKGAVTNQTRKKAETALRQKT